MGREDAHSQLLGLIVRVFLRSTLHHLYSASCHSVERLDIKFYSLFREYRGLVREIDFCAGNRSRGASFVRSNLFACSRVI